MVVMNSERWRQIERVWDQALELSRDERSAFLDCACAGDEELRDEVASLLAAHDACATFIEEPAIKYAAIILARKCQFEAGSE